jgi:DNA-directed RNA polymerase subunit beta
VPESFNVLVKEMRALGLNVELLNSEEALLQEETTEEERKVLPPAAE